MPHAQAAVAASIRAASIHLASIHAASIHAASIFAAAIFTASIFAASSGCLQSQDLGAADAGAADSAQTSDTASTFDPTLSMIDFDVTDCPIEAPEAGTRCPGNLLIVKSRTTPVQCSYDESIKPVGADGLSRHLCAKSCLCGFDDRWSCIDAPCAPPALRSCWPDMPCVGDAQCFYDCDGENPLCQKCHCSDQRLFCERKSPTL